MKIRRNGAAKRKNKMKTEKNAKGNTQVRPQVHFYKTKEGGEVGDEGADYADHHQSRLILEIQNRNTRMISLNTKCPERCCQIALTCFYLLFYFEKRRNVLYIYIFPLDS
jgi:hypothetical protein